MLPASAARGSSKRKLVTKLNLACIRDTETDSILAIFKCHYGHQRLNEIIMPSQEHSVRLSESHRNASSPNPKYAFLYYACKRQNVHVMFCL